MMTVSTQRLCQVLIANYRITACSDMRDHLFELMKPYLLIWLKSALRSRKEYKTSPEILSMTWDVFMTGLISYDFKDAIPQHFSNEAARIVRREIKTRQRTRRRQQSLSDTVEGDFIDRGDGYNRVLDDTLALKEFREFLPDDYRQVFEDAITAEAFENSRMKRSPVSGFPKHRYYEARRIFQWFIQFFMNQKERKTNGKGMSKRG